MRWASRFLDAAWAGADGVVQLLLSAKANVNPTAFPNRQRLWKAATHSGVPACVFSRMRAKAQLSQVEQCAVGLTTWSTMCGWCCRSRWTLMRITVLRFRFTRRCCRSAVASSHIDVVRALLKAHASVNYVPCRRGGGVLKAAAAKGVTLIVAELLQAKAEVDLVDDNAVVDGKTPLWVAAEARHMETMHALLHARAAVDRADTTWGQGYTPLLVAVTGARHNDDAATDTVEALLRAKADPSRRGTRNDGRPLQCGNVDVARALTWHGRCCRPKHLPTSRRMPSLRHRWTPQLRPEARRWWRSCAQHQQQQPH
jgi:hypothetical protein